MGTMRRKGISALLGACFAAALPGRADEGKDGVVAPPLSMITQVDAGQRVRYTVLVRSPLPEASVATVRLVAPAGWVVEPAVQTIEAAGGGGETWTTCEFDVVAGDQVGRRRRLAADVAFDGRPYGQQAEALVDVIA